MALSVIETAEAQVGYLEKRSAQKLDAKTANAGDGNYTKYARDLFPSLQGQAWCAMFVCWCMWVAYGAERAKALLCGGFEAYTPTSAGRFRRAGRWGSKPLEGALIYFHNGERICHVGLVYAVSGGRVYTIEGNTSGANGVIANGGGVCKKSYDIGNSRIAGYGYPDYAGVLGDNTARLSRILRQGCRGEDVKLLQRALNEQSGAMLTVDGEYGPLTAAAVRCWQSTHALEVDGEAGPLTLGSLGL